MKQSASPTLNHNYDEFVPYYFKCVGLQPPPDLRRSLPCSLPPRWGVLFSHPRDYTPVCTTELGRAARLGGEFSKRQVKMIALSIDGVEEHRGWTKVTRLHLNIKAL